MARTTNVAERNIHLIYERARTLTEKGPGLIMGFYPGVKRSAIEVTWPRVKREPHGVDVSLELTVSKDTGEVSALFNIDTGMRSTSSSIVGLRHAALRSGIRDLVKNHHLDSALADSAIGYLDSLVP